MTNPFIDAIGTQHWRNEDGKRHRIDGPAIIYADGSQSWYVNGKLHREDGPAYIGANGTQEWWVNGKCHREDGPAIIWADGRQEWFADDIRSYSSKEYQQVTNLSDEEMTVLVLKYGNVC